MAGDCTPIPGAPDPRSGDPYAPCGQATIPVLGGDPVAILRGPRDSAVRIALPQTPAEIVADIQAAKVREKQIAEATRPFYTDARLASGETGLVERAVLQVERAGREIFGSASQAIDATAEAAIDAGESAGGVVGAIANGARKVVETATSAGFGIGLGATVLIGLGAYIALRR